MTQTDRDEIMSAVTQAIRRENGRYVPHSLCQERSGTLKRAIYGLYAVMALILVGVVVQIVAQLISNGKV